MLTGVYAARNILGERNDVWAVNTELEYHEEARAQRPTTVDRLTPERVSVSVPLLPEEIIETAFARLDPLALGLAVSAVGGAGIFLATALLLLRGGDVVGPNLALLGQYFVGFRPTWGGAFIGLAEAGIFGFLLGFAAAWLRNWGLAAYAVLLERRAAAAVQRDLLDKI